MSNRISRGVPTGGQFAASAKDEPDVTLDPSDSKPAKAPKVLSQTSPPPMLPHEWAKAAGITHHSRQGDALYLAPTKKALAEVLTERGVSEYEAKVLSSRTRAEIRSHDGGPRVGIHWQALIDSGAVDTSRPGVYFTHDHRVDAAVFRVDPGGEIVTVAIWRRNPDPSWGAAHLVVEPTGN